MSDANHVQAWHISDIPLRDRTVQILACRRLVDDPYHRAIQKAAERLCAGTGFMRFRYVTQYDSYTTIWSSPDGAHTALVKADGAIQSEAPGVTLPEQEPPQEKKQLTSTLTEPQKRLLEKLRRADEIYYGVRWYMIRVINGKRWEYFLNERSCNALVRKGILVPVTGDPTRHILVEEPDAAQAEQAG